MVSEWLPVPPGGLWCRFCSSFPQIRELELLLGPRDSPSQLIWTSSRSAQKSNFSLEDVQHSRGQEPYSSSKYVVDLLSVALNRHGNERVRPLPVLGRRGSLWKAQCCLSGGVSGRTGGDLRGTGGRCAGTSQGQENEPQT